jgi:hypothetical protein
MDVVPVLERPMTKILGRRLVGGWSSRDATMMSPEMMMARMVRFVEMHRGR